MGGASSHIVVNFSEAFNLATHLEHHVLTSNEEVNPTSCLNLLFILTAFLLQVLSIAVRDMYISCKLYNIYNIKQVSEI